MSGGRSRLTTHRGGNGLQAATAHWLNSLRVRPDNITVNAADRFIFAGIQHGWWTKLVEGWLCIAGGPSNLTDAVASLKGAATAFTPAFVNTVTAVPKLGIVGDGTTSFYKTGLNLAALLDVNNHGFVAGITTNLTGSAPTECGALQTSNTIQVHIRGSDGLRLRVADTSSDLSGGNGNAFGLKAVMRTNASILYLAADSVTSDASQAVTTLPDTVASSQAAQFCLLKGGVNGSSFATNRIDLCMIYSPALTKAEYALLASDYRQLHTDLGVQNLFPEIPAQSIAAAGVFDKTAINSVTPANLRVFMWARPPADNTIDKDTYNFFPVTDFITQEGDAGTISSTFTPSRGGGVWANHWQDRYIPPGYTRNPNSMVPIISRTTTLNDANGNPYIVAGTDCRILFSSYVNACASTLTKIAHSIGWASRNEARDPRGWGYLDYMESFPGAPYSGTYGSSTLLGANCNTWANASTNANTLFQTLYGSFAVTTDIVVLKQARLIDLTNFAVKGIFMDSEAQDFRDQGLHALAYGMAAEICHLAGCYFTWVTNTEASETSSGFGTTSAPQLMSTSDFFNVNASHANPKGDIIASITAQLGYAKGASGTSAINYAKVGYMQALGVGSNVTTLAEANLSRAYVLANNLPCILIVRSGQAEVNRPDVIAAMCGIVNPAA